jgi:iron complex transport system substrate-binding protein
MASIIDGSRFPGPAWFCAALVFVALAAPGGAPGAHAGTVRDAVGRTVEVPADPKRIVSLAPNIS